MSRSRSTYLKKKKIKNLFVIPNKVENVCMMKQPLNSNLFLAHMYEFFR